MPATSGAIRAGRAFVELFAEDSRLVRGLKRAEIKLKAFGNRVRSIGMRLAAVTAAAATPFALSTRTFATFEQRMARVRALTGATGRDFARLENEAKRLGETTVFTASEAAEAMSFFALAGYEVDEILAAMGPTLNLAAAGQMEIAQAADVAAKIMAGMGIAATDVGGAIDVLTKAMTTANTDLVMLGDAMKFVGPIAKSAGIQFEEIVAAIQLLSNAGIQGEMAGTTLRGAILSLTSPSKEAKHELDSLGVAVSDANGNVRPLADIIEDLSKAIDGLGTGEKLDVIGRIFRNRQAAGVAELLAQGSDELREFTRALEQAGGTAERIAATQLDTLQGDVTLLRSVVEGLAIVVGQTLRDHLRNAVQVVTKIVSSITAWVKAHRGLVIMIASSVVIAGTLAVTLIGLGIAIKALGIGFGLLTSAFSLFSGTIGIAGKLLGVVLKLLVPALLSPVGLLTAVVIGLGIAILHTSGAGGKALKWLGEKFAVLRDGALKAFGGIKDALAAGDFALAARILWLSLKLAWIKGTKPITDVWRKAMHFFTTVGVNAFFQLRKAWETVANWFWKNFPEFTGTLAMTWANMWSDFRSIAAKARGFFADLFTEIQGYFDPELDVEAVKRENRADTERELADIEHKRRDAEAEAMRKMQRSDAEREREHQQALEELDTQHQRTLDHLNDQYQEKMGRAEDELNQARKEWIESIEQARAKREAAESGDALDGGGPSASDFASNVKNSLSALDDTLARVAQRTIEVQGTFSPIVARLLTGQSDAEERTARASEQTARHTKRIADAADQGGLAFT